MLRVTKQTVGKWRARFLVNRLDGLLDEPRPGAPRRIGDEKIDAVVTQTLESAPRDANHWSTRSMAQFCGLSHMTVKRIWAAFGLEPQRVETFKLSTDPLFVGKVRDIVGLYMDPPGRALVLSVDEKSQIQALDRSQPVLPMRPGQPERRSHDYKRYGTTTLFAALDTETGRVIGQCHRRHRSIEFRTFLDTIDDSVPVEQEVHLIMNNYGTHKTVLIKRWLAKRPRFHVPFSPTSASWINMVERFLQRCRTSRFVVASTAAPGRWRRRSGTFSKFIMSRRNHFAGPNLPMRSSPAFPDFVNELQLQDTRLAAYFSFTTRLRKCPIVPGPSQSARAPVVSPSFRSWMSRQGCSALPT